MNICRGISVSSIVLSALVSSPTWAADVPADPSDYKAKFDSLQPGDVLVLGAGDYTEGLRIEDVAGQSGAPITIRGPSTGSPARFVGRSCCNTIDLRNAAYVTIENIVFDGNGEAVDAIKAGGGASDWTHHITIEGCRFENHDAGQTSQQVVAISTKIVSWDWLVRGNVIDGAGTGAYFGNSDGSGAFIGGVIEGNLFADTLGYNMQVKHQNARESVPGVPTEKRVTVIRHNVFIKKDNPSPSGGRPNLLVSGFPDSGPGSDDHVEIYGNFFYHNDEDSLFQASGRVHLHDNIFVDSSGSAVRFVNHQGKTVIDALVYSNTIYDTGRGVNFADAPSGTSVVMGNAIFSDQPLSGVSGESDNITDSVGAAQTYVNNPSTVLGEMDFYPLGPSLVGTAFETSAISGDLDYDRDFNGDAKDFSYRGAYHGSGSNPGWALDATLKSLPDGSTSSSSGPSGSGAGGSGTGSATGGASTGAAGGAAGSDDEAGCDCGLAPGRGGPGHSHWLGLLLASVVGFRRRYGDAH